MHDLQRYEYAKVSAVRSAIRGKLHYESTVHAKLQSAISAELHKQKLHETTLHSTRKVRYETLLTAQRISELQAVCMYRYVYTKISQHLNVMEMYVAKDVEFRKCMQTHFSIILFTCTISTCSSSVTDSTDVTGLNSNWHQPLQHCKRAININI